MDKICDYDEAFTRREMYEETGRCLEALVDEKRLSKRAMCSLCIPFRDKYGLTDLQTLRIARKEMELSEMVDLLEGGGDGGQT